MLKKICFVFIILFCVLTNAKVSVNLFGNEFFLTPEIEDEVCYYLQKEIGENIEIKEIKYNYSEFLTINNEYVCKDFMKNVEFVDSILDGGLYIEKEKLKERNDYYEPGEDLSPHEAAKKISELEDEIMRLELYIEIEDEKIATYESEMNSQGGYINVWYQIKIKECIDKKAEYEVRKQEVEYAIAYYQEFMNKL